MESGKSLIATLGVLVLAFGVVGSASAQAPTCGNAIYEESFTDGTFDDTQSALDNETGPLTQPLGVSGEAAYVNAGAEALEITNVPESDGWLLATLDAPLPAGAEVVLQAVVSVTKGLEISHHAYILQPRQWDDLGIGLTIKACEVNADYWDLDIWTSDLAAGSVRAGLTLDKAISGETAYYTVTQRILIGGEQAEVYLDDQYVDTYLCNTDRTEVNPLVSLRVGNGHQDYGFYNALFSDVRICIAAAEEPSNQLSRCDGSIFHETFNGGVYSEPGRSLLIGPGAYFNNNAALFVNSGLGQEGEYNANLPPTSTTSEYALEVAINVSSGGELTENAMVMNPYDLADDVAVDLKLEAKEIVGDPNNWDLQIVDVGGEPGVMAGLSISKDEYHYVTQRHLGNPAGDVELYVDATLVGTYTDQDKTKDLDRIQLGNVSGAINLGFGFAWFTTISLGNFGLPAPPECGDPGTLYLQSDLNKDCRVNLPDISIIASEWLYCTDPADSNCDQYLPLASP